MRFLKSVKSFTKKELFFSNKFSNKGRWFSNKGNGSEPVDQTEKVNEESKQTTDSKQVKVMRKTMPSRTNGTRNLWNERLASIMERKKIDIDEKREEQIAFKTLVLGGDASHSHVAKKMKDSFCEITLNFKAKPELLDEYVSSYGGVRVGKVRLSRCLYKILEDLDALAGTIAYLHCDDHNQDTQPLTIVTASVDRIDLLNQLDRNANLRLSGA
jgi:acyl-coenzyme A thioesterase 9